MLRRRSFVLALFALLVSCGQRDEAGGSGGSGANVRVEPGNVGGLAVRGEAGTNGEVSPVVQARGQAPVRVKRAITVERREGERWTSVSVSDLTLRPDCSHAADPCITLVHGGGLMPPAWNGETGKGQCTAATSRDAPMGTYRFVLESCEGDTRVLGEPFALTR